MSSYMASNAALSALRFTGHVWRDRDGNVNATVDAFREDGGHSCWLAFDDPADARALAAACTEAAEAMERSGIPMSDEEIAGIEVPF
jgi:hypothetical protein